MEEKIKKYLHKKTKEGLLRELKPVSLKKDGKLVFDDKEYINFSSNDYLGLSTHSELLEVSREHIFSVFGSTSSRLMTGSTHLHHILEEWVAKFKNKPAAIVFNSGYQANVGIISTLIGRGDVVFSDKLNHASIVDGIKLSGAKLFRFRHNDSGHLKELLEKERKNFDEALIITETVFSMDGDLAPLEEIAKLKEEYNSLLMVDEAHATGVFGKDGAGLANDKRLEDKVDIIMGTFSKALGSFGAYAATSSGIKKYLVNKCRSFIYSTSLPASIIAANIKAIEIVEKEPHRRKVLLDNAEYLRNKLIAEGLDVRGESQIIPVIIGDNERTVELSESLKEKGYWVTPVRPPTVPKGEARLRISLSYNHTKEDIDKFIKDLSRFL